MFCRGHEEVAILNLVDLAGLVDSAIEDCGVAALAEDRMG